MSTSSIKRQIRRFHVVVVQWTSKKCTKKRDARAQLLFWSLNLLFLKLPIILSGIYTKSGIDNGRIDSHLTCEDHLEHFL